MEGKDSAGSQDYLSAKPVTNAWAELVPYEVAFHGFSSELAAVLEGLSHLPQGIVVTNLVVEPVEAVKPSPLNLPKIGRAHV